MELTRLQTLAHEIKSPLQALMVTSAALRAQLAKLNPESAKKLAHHFDNLTSEINRLDRLLNSATSVAAAAPHPTDLHPTSLPPLIKSGSGSVLIIDDDADARNSLAELISSWGYTIILAENGVRALDILGKNEIGLIICDWVMPKISGIDLLKKLKTETDAPIIMLTALGSIDCAVAAMKEGASDYLTKPIEPLRLQKLLTQLTERSAYLSEIGKLRLQLRELGRFGPLVGKSPAMRELYQAIEQAAPSQAAVIIEGASGTGKELVARAIHELSPRAAKSFIAINCSAIPATLLESEIFGYERGAFTGAVKTKEGCFELAGDGTLFLDEITEMAPELQIKLLRVLEDGSFRRIGGKVELRANVRLIAASNSDFRNAIAKGKLREDLYYRLNVFHLKLPTLKERAEDIPLLTQHFIEEFNLQNQKQVRAAEPQVVTSLQNYSWPGNVRELRNVIERAVIVTTKNLLGLADIVEHVRGSEPTKLIYPKMLVPLGITLEKVEVQVIEKTLELTRGNKTAAAKKLGITPKTLHNKLKNLQ